MSNPVSPEAFEDVCVRIFAYIHQVYCYVYRNIFAYMHTHTSIGVFRNLFKAKGCYTILVHWPFVATYSKPPTCPAKQPTTTTTTTPAAAATTPTSRALEESSYKAP